MSYAAVLCAYIKRHAKALGVLCVFALTFCAVFSLYDLPMEAVAYSVVLCAFFGAVFIVLESINYYKRHILLREMANNITSSGTNIPQGKDIIEEDYRALAELLAEENRRIISKYDGSIKDMTDYYTMWVHQIKTPISAMDLLLQNGDCSQRTELSAELFKIDRYAEMVLGYLKIDSISADLLLKKYSLDDIVKRAVRKYSKLFIAKKLVLRYEALHVEVLTDEKWLTFVIEQLLSNAVKYTSKGAVSVYMEQGSDCTLVIEDEGMGIQSEDIPRVFENGFTGFNGRINRKSTGIGLYLCKKITDKLSHKINIESTVGVGTKVKIDMSMLPLEIE